jgi:hypothetical protein
LSVRRNSAATAPSTGRWSALSVSIIIVRASVWFPHDGTLLGVRDGIAAEPALSKLRPGPTKSLV